jgi:hypothetical protein
MSDLYPAVDIVNGNIIGEQIVNTIGSLISVDLESENIEADNVEDALKEINRKAVHFKGFSDELPLLRDADVLGGRIFPTDIDRLKDEITKLYVDLENIKNHVEIYNPDDDYFYLGQVRTRKAGLKVLVIIDSNGWQEGYSLGAVINGQSSGWTYSNNQLSCSAVDTYSRASMINGGVDVTDYNKITVNWHIGSKTGSNEINLMAYSGVHYFGLLTTYYANVYYISIYMYRTQTPTDLLGYTTRNENKNGAVGKVIIDSIIIE